MKSKIVYISNNKLIVEWLGYEKQLIIVFINTQI